MLPNLLSYVLNWIVFGNSVRSLGMVPRWAFETSNSSTIECSSAAWYAPKRQLEKAYQDVFAGLLGAFPNGSSRSKQNELPCTTHDLRTSKMKYPGGAARIRLSVRSKSLLFQELHRRSLSSQQDASKLK